MTRCSWLMPMPSRDFAPAGDLLSVRPESRQRVAPAKPPLRGALRCSKPRAAPNSRRYALLRQAARSQSLKRAALAPWASALLSGFEGESWNSRSSQQPTAKPDSRASRGIPLAPLSTAEQRKALRARAQHASSSDSAQLFEQSAAARVLRGPSRPEQHRAPRSEAQGRCVRGELFAYFLAGQKVGRPPGRNPGTGLATAPKERQT